MSRYWRHHQRSGVATKSAVAAVHEISSVFIVMTVAAVPSRAFCREKTQIFWGLPWTPVISIVFALTVVEIDATNTFSLDFSTMGDVGEASNHD